MRNMSMVRIVLCLLLVGLCFSYAYGEDEDGELFSFLEDWHFKITHYFWWADAKGDITVEDRTEVFRFEAPVELSDLGGITLFEAWRRDWGFAGYWVSADFEEDFEQDGTSYEATIKPWIIHVGFGYKFAEIPFGKDRQPDWMRNISMYVVGGLRYWDVETEVDFYCGETVAVEEQWVEPFISARVTMQPAKRLVLGLSGGFGGFGIGSSDDFTWHFTAGAEYLFSKYLSLSFGYAMLDAGYTAESGTQEIEIDTEFSGPALALIFRF